MAIYQFIAELENDNYITYYARCKNVKAYIRNIRCQWNKKYKSEYERNPNATIYSIIGGAHGEFDYTQLQLETQCDKGICKPQNEKDTLQFFINIDKSSINLYKMNFNKVAYNKQYREDKKKLTFMDLSIRKPVF